MAAPPEQPGRLRRAARAFRHWRQSRPFWGGLLVTLGGLEILASERAPLPLIIHIGLQGLAGYMVPVVLVLCGLLLLFHPVQRTFYSLLAVVLSLGSWITSNLGGFFIGMLLGLIGGALAFAWVRRAGGEPVRQAGGGPRQPGQQGSQPPRHTRSVGIALVRGDRPPGGDESGSAKGMNLSPSGHPVIIAMPLAPLALSMLAAMASRGLLGGAMPLAPPIASPSVSPSASPSVSPSGSPIPSPSGSPTPSPSGSPTPGPTIVSSPPPSPVPSGSPTKHAKKPKVTARAPAGSVAVDRFSLTSRFAALAGLTYDGIAAVPTAQGPQRMLKFTMRSLRLPGIVLTVTQGGHSFVTADSSMRFIGDVQLYTTKLTGVIAGIRVTFTSANPPKSLPANLTLTDVTAEQPFATADVLQAAQSQVSAG